MGQEIAHHELGGSGPPCDAPLCYGPQRVETAVRFRIESASGAVGYGDPDPVARADGIAQQHRFLVSLGFVAERTPR